MNQMTNQISHDRNSKIDKSQKEDNDDEDNEDDHKPTIQEKKQADNAQEIQMKTNQ